MTPTRKKEKIDFQNKEADKIKKLLIKVESQRKQLKEFEIKVDELNKSAHHWWLETERLNKKIQFLRNTVSWRITWPIRLINLPSFTFIWKKSKPNKKNQLSPQTQNQNQLSPRTQHIYQMLKKGMKNENTN